MTHEEFKERVIEKRGDIFEFLSKYNGSNKEIKVKNKICNHEYTVNTTNRLYFKRGGQCPKCYPSDLTGKKFGKLLVIKKCKHKGDYKTWLCKCDCGNTKPIRHTDLMRKNGEGTKSCGCKLKEKDHLKDLTNNTYGDLTVIKRKGSKHKQRLWQCRCKCGNTREVKTSDLIKSIITKCFECVINEQNRENDKINYIGKKYSLLTITKVIREKGRQPIAICDCDCGEQDIKRGLHNLQTAKNKNVISSCGCGKKKDLQGKKFGKLKVLYEGEFIEGKKIKWKTTKNKNVDLLLRLW